MTSIPSPRSIDPQDPEEEEREPLKVYPPWIPRRDWGHWNERWGTNLPKPPVRRRTP